MMGRIRVGTRAGLLGVLAVSLLAACGGGGGESGNGPQAATTVASEGPIDGFGSVIMNGVRWNTDTAVFEVEGRPGSQDDLAVGMVVRVEGERFADGSARADRVVFESSLRGPVRSIVDAGPDARILEIFGLEAIVSRATTRLDGLALEQLAVDRVLDLSGFVNGDGQLEVTHLRSRGAPVVNATEVKLFGRVSGLAGGSFMIGTTEIRFDDATILDDFGPGGLRDGLAVRVEGLLRANDAVDAREIETPRRGGDDRFGETEIHGIVSAFVSLSSEFQVAGRAVDASRATLEPNDPALMRDGIRVEVEGVVDAAGVLQAKKLKFRSHRVRIYAEVAAELDIEVAEDQLWLLDVPVELDASTEVRDQRDGLSSFDLPDLSAGDFVEVRGFARSDGTVIASRFERAPHDDLRIRGAVDFVDEAGHVFTIQGVSIPTGPGTRFQSNDGTVLSESEFYARLRPGIVVDAKDREDGDETDFDFADEVEFEEPVLIDRDDEAVMNDAGSDDSSPGVDDGGGSSIES